MKTKSLDSFKNDKLEGLKNIKGGTVEITYYSGVESDLTDDETCDTVCGDFYWLEEAPDTGGGDGGIGPSPEVPITGRG